MTWWWLRTRKSQNPNGSLDEAFLYIDALAKLVILLVRFQGESAGILLVVHHLAVVEVLKERVECAVSRTGGLVDTDPLG
jgi:hypothetical protein